MMPHLLWHMTSWWFVFCSFIKRTAPFCRLLRYTRGCGRSNLTWTLTDLKLIECVIVLLTYIIYKWWKIYYHVSDDRGLSKYIRDIFLFCPVKYPTFMSVWNILDKKAEFYKLTWNDLSCTYFVSRF
jgi:hypothetical protein